MNFVPLGSGAVVKCNYDSIPPTHRLCCSINLHDLRRDDRLQGIVVIAEVRQGVLQPVGRNSLKTGPCFVCGVQLEKFSYRRGWPSCLAYQTLDGAFATLVKSIVDPTILSLGPDPKIYHNLDSD